MNFSIAKISNYGLNSKPINAANFPPQHFAKKAFDFKANLNAPEQRDVANVALLGDDIKGAGVYLLA